MVDPFSVRFQPVDDDADPDEEASRRDPAGQRPEPGPAREAERDPYPLAGPILEGARSELLRGRCSACDSRLRVRLEPDQQGSVRVRCPICGRTGEVQAP